MNIKSELLNKTTKWFPNFTLGALGFSIVASVILSLVIIGVGVGIYLKLIAAGLGLVTIFIWTFDSSITDKKNRNKVLKVGFGIFILTSILIEIPLYFKSKNTYTYPIKIVETEHYRDGDRIPDNDNVSANDKFKQIKYYRILFFDTRTNHQIGSRKFNIGEENQMKIYTDIIGKEIYYDYFPFFVFSEEFKYLRDNNGSK